MAQTNRIHFEDARGRIAACQKRGKVWVGLDQRQVLFAHTARQQRPRERTGAWPELQHRTGLGSDFACDQRRQTGAGGCDRTAPERRKRPGHEKRQGIVCRHGGLTPDAGDSPGPHFDEALFAAARLHGHCEERDK